MIARTSLQGRGLRFPCNDRMDEVSYFSSYCKVLLALEKRRKLQEVIRGHVHWTEKNLAIRSKPEVTEEIVSLKMRQFLSLLRQDLGKI